jgi:hypothetical protein
MIAINKLILFSIIFLVSACPYVQAVEEVLSTEEAQNKKDIADLIAENSAAQTFLHQDWADRNPFDTTPLGEGMSIDPVMSTDFVLQGIFLGSNKPSAIINGNVVGLADKIKDVTVKQIKNNAVILEDSRGNQTVLSLKK